ncbi:AAA family ATPase [Stella sp.]|uniref:AAA family ATPase n=1 Tax=Stella sp. TaxID=2912054 RepID=UPI0035AF95C7
MADGSAPARPPEAGPGPGPAEGDGAAQRAAVHFAKLRLAGFKSFVDPTELWIEPGLTGIVGPNGCGKSNLVEALRWVMGENSARRMRGGEMDDLIFGGTTARPARNVAEVTVLLDNSSRTGPALLAEVPEIEVARRIERGGGSIYRLNGRETRQRDVQTLFADLGTGPQSSSLVSQGRVGAIINAKPEERRGLLEEAAGIAGLHARKHEAELRLRAAEQNLTRLDDVLATLDTQLEQLRRQARQATRYRKVGEQIRRTEALLLHRQWQAATAAETAAEAALHAAGRTVDERAETATLAAAHEEAAAAALPDLRERASAAQQQVQNLAVERQALEAEATRVAAARAQLAERLAQLAADERRERGFAADSVAALARLDAEAADNRAGGIGETEVIEAALVVLREAKEAVARQDRLLAEATQRTAAEEARRVALDRQAAAAGERLARLRRDGEAAERERAQWAAAAIAEEAMAAARQAAADAESRVEAERARAAEAATAWNAAEAVQAGAAQALRAAEGRRTEFNAERTALERLLTRVTPGGPPIVDAMAVAAGFEAALGAALGDDLEIPAEGIGAARWTAYPPYPAPPVLPDGAEPLDRHVSGPPAMARRLGQIGIVADRETGQRLAPSLSPGQRLVTRAGDLWRWDGVSVAAGTPSAAAQRLGQRNRLAEVSRLFADADADAQRLRREAADADAARRAAQQDERAARDAQSAALTAFARSRDRLAALEREAAQTASRLSAVAARLERIAAETAEAQAAVDAIAAERAALPDTRAGREEVDRLRRHLADLRLQQAERQSAHDRLVREAVARRERLARIEAERTGWQGRSEAAAAQIATLTDRAAAARAEDEALAGRPDEIARERDALAARADAAAAARAAAAAALSAAEAGHAEAQRRVKAAEAAWSTAREERVRAEAALQHAVHARLTLLARIQERVEATPEDLPGLAAVEDGQATQDAADVERRLERLLREREAIGPVNLMAEQEATEVDGRIQGLVAERADLTGAIQRLRQGIAALNREGRERLLASFDKVNAHFQELFVGLFGGGRAHLAMTEAEDPLDAGLEIMASPPGKKLQVMSLLSGGEQALTALALLFAVFQTNPSPICVLDEVDAPLDDANVDRFCALVSRISAQTGTRFLVITHHRITMARMDRLFGVTMVERGVSQLVSVDLQAAERIRQTG